MAMANPQNTRFSLDAVNARYNQAFAEAWHPNASPETRARVAGLGRDLAECYEDQAKHSSPAYRDLEIARELRALAAWHDEVAGRAGRLIPAEEQGPLGNPLREWRIAQGLSRRALAEALGVSPRTVEQWEQGRRAGPPGRVLALALAALERERDHTARPPA